jgi:hypothetical protein
MTNDILGVQWQSVTLYPAGYNSRKITVQPNLTVPAGWQYGSALEQQARNGDEVAFKPLDLETLIDSPLFAGRYFRRIDLDPGADSRAPERGGRFGRAAGSHAGTDRPAPRAGAAGLQAVQLAALQALRLPVRHQR